MSFSKLFFAIIFFVFSIVYATANCIDLTGFYQCDNGNSVQISQTTNGQNTTIYNFSSAGQRPVQYTTDGQTLTKNELISVCNQEYLRVYSPTYGFLIDYGLDASDGLTINAYSAPKNRTDPNNLSAKDLSPIPASEQICRKMALL